MSDKFMIITSDAIRDKRRDTKARANDIFAKIISKEGLILRRSHKARTANFNPEKRVLTLPIFARSAPNFVEEGMIIHEVGHALFTTAESLKRFEKELMPKGIPFAFLNIFEDVRINKKMALRYKGVKAIHNVYYEYLFDAGFFGKHGGDGMNFADKVNVFFKVGPYSGIKIKECPEWDIFGDKIIALSTEDDVYNLSLELFEYYKAEAEKRKAEKAEREAEEKAKEEDEKNETEPADEENEASEEEAGGDTNDADNEDSDSEEELDAEADDAEASENEEADSEDDASEDDVDVTVETETEEADEDEMEGGSSTDLDFDEDEDDAEKLEMPASDFGGDEASEDSDDADNDENEAGSGDETADSEADEDDSDEELDANLESTTNDEFENNMESFVEDENIGSKYEDGKNTINTIRIEKNAHKNVFTNFTDIVTADYPNFTSYENYSFTKSVWLPFLAEIKPIVNRMVNDFESKKAAAEFARTQVSDSGSLDITKLHQYKINDDIFLKNAFTPEGKNHGIVLMLDGSGSMSGARYLKVMKQAIILSMFAKRVNIAFSVVQFSSKSYRDMNNTGGNVEDNESEAYIGFKRSLMIKLFNNTMKQSVLFDTFEKAYELAYSYWTTSRNCTLGGNSLAVKRGKEVSYAMSNILGGTPIESSVLMMTDYIKEFKMINATEINTFVMLTDGSSTGFNFNNENMSALKIDMSNLRFAFDSSNKSYEAKYEKSKGSSYYNEGDLVKSSLRALKAETGVNIIEIKLDELTHAEREMIKKDGFVANHSPNDVVNLSIKYQSNKVAFEHTDHEDDLVNEIVIKGKEKKVDLMFASLVSEIVAKNM